MGIGSIGGTYLNFILGTGSEQIGNAMKTAIKNRGVSGQSFTSALYNGAKQGIKDSYNAQKAAGGFFKSIKQGFSSISQGWKAEGLKGAFKGCGKAMPALFAGIALLAEVPNIVKAVKEKGFVQGLKETGKTAIRLTCGAIGGALGTLIPGIPVLGSMAGWSIGEWIGSKIVGKSYSEQVADNQKNGNNGKSNSVPNNSDDMVTLNTYSNPGSVINLPSIDANDFGPNRPYSNVFYNYPGAYVNMAMNPTPIVNNMGMGYPIGGFNMMNNVSGNLLNMPVKSGNLLNPNR